MPTYLDGLHTALTWITWAAGALTPLAALGLLALLLWWVGGLFDQALTVQQIRRRARRTGRYTGP